MVAISVVDGVPEIDCVDALEFVSVLDPVNSVFTQPLLLPTYVFRGTTSSAHDLVPKAFRDTAVLFHRGYWHVGPLGTREDQCRAEFETLKLFFDIAAREGIRLPEDSQFLRKQLEEADQALQEATLRTPFMWPPQHFLSLLALAQHYGVATRALDWTWDPLVAAYFAARDANYQLEERIAVWVFTHLGEQIDRVLEPATVNDRSLVFFSAPGADNANLRAQRGLFMSQVHRLTGAFEPFVPRSYRALLQEALPGLQGLALVLRVTTPSREAPRVLRHLATAGVTGARLFPGLWGVAREMDERRLLNTVPSGIVRSELSAEINEELGRLLRRPGA